MTPETLSAIVKILIIVFGGLAIFVLVFGLYAMCRVAGEADDLMARIRRAQADARRGDK